VLSRLLGLDKQNLTTTLTSLLTSGVASREQETGAIYSRRMVRDEKLRNIRSEAGKQGGNPLLVKQNPTTPVKQNLTPSSSSSTSTTKNRSIPSASVRSLYEAYPRHEAPKDAYRAIEKALKVKTADQLMAAIDRYKAKTITERTEIRFIPLPASWFNAGRYDDDMTAHPPQTSNRGNRNGTGNAILEALAESLRQDQDGFSADGDDEGGGQGGRFHADLVLEAPRQRTP
jgi:hypothetical protein